MNIIVSKVEREFYIAVSESQANCSMYCSLLAELQTYKERKHLANICLDAHVSTFGKPRLFTLSSSNQV